MPDLRVPETPEQVLAAVAEALGWGHSTCRGKTCGCRIYWAQHSKTGNTVPIDGALGLNHHITCPDRGSFRRSRSERRES